MNDRVIGVGFTSRSTPLGIREALQVNCAADGLATGEIAEIARELVILSTCNRYEVYAISTCVNRHEWSRRLATAAGLPASDIARSMRLPVGSSAERHLLRVAAGLESRIVGEPHVLGQVRRAFLAAVERGMVGPMLSALFRSAIHTGKRVRHETGIASGACIGTVVVDRLDRVIGPGGGRTTLIVGSGEVARDVATILSQRRTDHIVVVSRNVQRAAELAGRVGGSAAGLAELPVRLRTADACIVCTAANDYVVTQEMVGRRDARRCHIIDLAVPRNVEPAVANTPGVDLTHLDELSPERLVRAPAVVAADRIVADELERLHQWQRARRIAPLIASLLHPDPRGRDNSRTTRARKRALHRHIMVLKNGWAA